MVKAGIEARRVILRNGEGLASVNQAAAFDLLALGVGDGRASFGWAVGRLGAFWERVRVSASDEFSEGQLCYAK